MLRIFAPAKINLHLHVTGKREDGYHFLDSLVCFADAGDTLFFEAAQGFEFQVEGKFASDLKPHDRNSSPTSGNTIVRAAWLLADMLARELNVKITLQKNLPLGAGIGGGSADAAACLWGLCQFWSLNLPEDYLHNIALKIGSDVPVCLKSQPVIMQGIGDIIKPAPELPEFPVVLIWPNQHASTPEVFNHLGLTDFSGIADFKTSYSDLKDLTADLQFKTRNDLEKSARELFPVITEVLETFKEEKDCRLIRMSGSGSMVFGIFENEDASLKAAEKIQALHPDWWVRPCWLNRTARY